MYLNLPSLQYSYEDLEPYFDKLTMNIHHTKHHQTYINNANNIIKNLPELHNLSIENILNKLPKIKEKQRIPLINNIGGHLNHSIFWKGLTNKKTFLKGELKKYIKINFGNEKIFKKLFEKISMNHFGSGWTWLIKKDKKLFIKSIFNQNNPLMGEKISGTYGYPILCLDLWEHAYYLKYQNRRLDYINAFWNIVNWEEAEKRFNKI